MYKTVTKSKESKEAKAVKDGHNWIKRTIGNRKELIPPP
jgi:hypothetical protein